MALQNEPLIFKHWNFMVSVLKIKQPELGCSEAVDDTIKITDSVLFLTSCIRFSFKTLTLDDDI
jgi:hypothetical protein